MLSVKLPSVKNITLYTIYSFTEYFLSLPRNDSFMCFSIAKDFEEIRDTKNFSQKRKKFIEIIRYFQEIETRTKYFDKEIDLREWKIGSIAWPLGRKYKIEKCPMCGKNGVYFPPYLDSFKGATSHVVIPFAMGWEEVIKCEPQTREEKLAEWMKEFELEVDEQGNFRKANS